MPSSSHSARGRATKAAVQKLESLKRAGVTHLGKVPWEEVEVSPPVASPATSTVGPKRAAQPPAPSAAAGQAKADASAALAALAKRVAQCTRCAELAQTRTQTVFGVGNPHARLAFLGEAPGADEDRQGTPFVGRAGKLLTDIIEKGMRIPRDEVYILNILRCRPPGNRNPTPVEAAACRQWLDKTLEIIQPEFICCLGAVAAQNLLDTTVSIGKLRGHFHDYEGIKVLCTYHPAYLLRNPAAKKPTWDDIQILMAEMGLPRSGQ